MARTDRIGQRLGQEGMPQTSNPSLWPTAATWPLMRVAGNQPRWSDFDRQWVSRRRGCQSTVTGYLLRQAVPAWLHPKLATLLRGHWTPRRRRLTHQPRRTRRERFSVSARSCRPAAPTGYWIPGRRRPDTLPTRPDSRAKRHEASLKQRVFWQTLSTGRGEVMTNSYTRKSLYRNTISESSALTRNCSSSE